MAFYTPVPSMAVAAPCAVLLLYSLPLDCRRADLGDRSLMADSTIRFALLEPCKSLFHRVQTIFGITSQGFPVQIVN